MSEDWRAKLKATTQEERQAHLVKLGWTEEDARKERDIPWNIFLVSRPSDEDMKQAAEYLASPEGARILKQVQGETNG